MNDEYCPKHDTWFGRKPCPGCYAAHDRQRTLVVEAAALCESLVDIHRRMTEPRDDWEAYNDYRLDQVEQMCSQAHRRLERRKAAR